MEMPVVMDFINVISSMIDEKLASLDQTDIAQILTNDNGSGLYDIQLVAKAEGMEGTIVHNVVNSSGYSFKNGDYVVILKIKGHLDKSIILSGYNPNTNNINGTTINNTTIINEGEEWRDGDIIHY